MASPSRSWGPVPLQNSTQIQNSPSLAPGRSAPPLPQLPRASNMYPGGYNSYIPTYSGGGYGGYGGSYGMPYRSSMYGGGYGGFNNYGSYGMYGMGGHPGFSSDDAERRFISYAEESSRNTFASVESIVRAFNSISMMLDNTFFAMTSTFRAVLSVADNFGRLRTMFGQIWYSVSIFRLFQWFYRKFMGVLGRKVPRSDVASAWRQAGGAAAPGAPGGSNWPTLAFLGILVSAPYIISRFFLKAEVKTTDPATWKSPGVRAKAAFDFMARNQGELSVRTNDEVILAPTYVQEELKLVNSGWAFAVSNIGSGIIPLNYLIIDRGAPQPPSSSIPRVFSENHPILHQPHKSHTKRVSFGENQIFENVDLEDYVTGKKEIKSSLKPDKEQHEKKKDRIGDVGEVKPTETQIQ